MDRKKIVSFSINPHFSGQKEIEFKEKTDEKVQLDAVLFSTAYNRNNAFFQVSKLMNWKNKLKSILHNFNHDLSLTGGKYLGNETKLINIWSVEVDGEFEVWGTVESKDPVFISQAENITAPSIEILINEEDIISDQNGEYYKDFDFVGVAWLLGVVQGSGDARVEAVRHFDAGLNELRNFNNQNNINMNKEEIQAILAENNKEILSQFETRLNKKFEEVKTETDKTQKEFKEEVANQIKDFKVIGGSQSQHEGVYEWTDENGNQFKETTQSIYKSVTELLNDGEVKEDSKLTQMMEAKGFAIVKVEDDLDASVDNARNFIANMKQFRTNEGSEDGGRSANVPADAKASFKSDMKKQVRENIKNAS